MYDAIIQRIEESDDPLEQATIEMHHLAEMHQGDVESNGCQADEILRAYLLASGAETLAAAYESIDKL